MYYCSSLSKHDFDQFFLPEPVGTVASKKNWSSELCFDALENALL
jgi:hypothetical protein